MEERQLRTSDFADPGANAEDISDPEAKLEEVPVDDLKAASAGAELRPEAGENESEPLLPRDQTERFTERCTAIQAGFVDRPSESVEDADALVADLMQRLAAGFSNERERLEGQWSRGDDVSTRTCA